jgi:hypothetical protein
MQSTSGHFGEPTAAKKILFGLSNFCLRNDYRSKNDATALEVSPKRAIENKIRIKENSHATISGF